MPVVLVVDDAAFMRMRCSKLLKESGYEVLEAENGRDATNKYKSVHPDLVLMDITMPEMDGISATKAIRDIDPSAKIVMCSAMGQQALVIEAVKAGAKDFILKPFKPEKVLATIEKVLG